MDYFNTQHFFNSNKINQDLKNINLQTILFPETKVITDGKVPKH